jgi:hypothetical protein
MFSLLQGARALVFRYASEAECFWRAYQGALDSSKVHIIPNGYEGSIENCMIPQGDRCQIIYTGTLQSYRYDSLLEALKILKLIEPIGAKHLRLLFVGETPAEFGEKLQCLGLSDIVELRAPTTHNEIVRLQREAHGYLVLGRSSKMRGYELLVGAKLFEYIKGGRPIIGVLPSDETKNILKQLDVNTIADVSSPSEIVTLLLRVLEAWSTDSLSVLVPNRSLCERYSAEAQSAALCRALEGEPSLEPFVPGSVVMPPSLQAYIEKENWLN